MITVSQLILTAGFQDNLSTRISNCPGFCWSRR